MKRNVGLSLFLRILLLDWISCKMLDFRYLYVLYLRYDNSKNNKNMMKKVMELW